jgi:glycosyltransferase involved in cell wall biosynthesis
MMTVVTLVDRLVAGGAERIAAQVAAGLDADRFRSIICVSRWSEQSRDAAAVAQRAALETAGLRVLALGRRGRADVLSWRALTAVLRGSRADVLHAHMFGSNVWASVLGPACGVPLVLAHDHGLPHRHQSTFERVVTRAVVARGATRLVAVSEADRARMVAEGLPGERILVVPNGVSSPAGVCDRAAARARLGIATDIPLAVAVGRLHAVKAFDVLLRAAEPLRRLVPGALVLVAGEGPERPRLEALRDELGAGDVVRLLGRREDVWDLLAACDVTVSCSHSEASPLAIMEYMGAGRATVATAVGGVPEVVRDGVEGVLVMPDDPEALAFGLAALLDDPQRADALGAAARTRQVERFSLSAAISRLEAIYEDERVAGSLSRPVSRGHA